jgi:hypothetical protein
MAAGMQFGVDMAYRVIQRPTEGTILTVAREAAKYAVTHANEFRDFESFFTAVIKRSNEVLEKTPDMLPILKKAGVVDAGGKGLIILYEGMLASIRGTIEVKQMPVIDNYVNNMHEQAQHHFSTDEIEYGYCTEFMIHLNLQSDKRFDEQAFRHSLEQLGDSLLVIADEQVVKVHIHSEQPGTVLTEALQFGQLERIKIDNMRIQHEQIIGQPNQSNQSNEPITEVAFAFVAVANGLGMIECFRSLGANFVIEGGQSMNPSAEQFLAAFSELKAGTIFVLPNNSNVIMAARQASEMFGGDVRVIPSRSMQQGIAALVAFHSEASAEYNEQTMTDSLNHIQSGAITRAVRDSEIDDLSVREGDFIGIHNQQLIVAHQDCMIAFQQLIEKMINDDSVLITIYRGEDASVEDEHVLNDWLQQTYADLDIEWYDGGQPVYRYLVSVE